MWGRMGWQDIKQRYRRSALGPFWLTLSMGIMCGALGILYSTLFKIEVNDYLPFLCLGLLAWGLVSTIIIEGCTAFIVSEHLIKQIKLPLTIHVFRLVWRNLIIFAHNFVVYIVVAVVFEIWPGTTVFLIIPGLALLILNAVWISLLLGIICTRFRDVPQIISSLIQIAFFMTPIIWKPELLERHSGFVLMNPFYVFVELLRAPLLGQSLDVTSWIMAFVITLLGTTFTFVIFSRFRSRIAYWL
jgi:ABC-type polysaccharide/polyol phosphate export systems, permease component